MGHPRRELLGAVGAGMGRDTVLFAVSNALGLVLGLATAIVLTHLMPATEYGRLAVMLVVSSLLTTLYNLGTLQGVFMLVFGAVDDDADAAEGGAGAAAADPRRALSTGLLVTAGLGAAGTVVVAAAAQPLGELITGRPDVGGELRLAAACGALGAIWRLAVNVLRMERRAGSFVAMQILRPAAVLAVSIPLVAALGTAERALAGLLAGTGAGLLATLALSARSYAPRVALGLVPAMFSRGAPYVPVGLAFWVVHTADVYVVSTFATDARTGEYRLASRFGAIVSYFSSAFLMTWGPATRTTAWQAAEGSDRSGLRRLLVTWFVLAVTWLVLVVALFADLLVGLAAPSYGGAAGLVPLVALGFAFYALFVLVYRASEVKDKRSLYVRLAVAAAVLFVAAAIALTAAIGPAGAALANAVAFGVVTAVLVVAARRRGGTVPLDVPRLAAGVGLAVACWGAAVGLERLLDAPRAPVAVVFALAYPLALLGTGILPRHQVRALVAALSAQLRPRAANAPLLERLDALPADERAVLEAAGSRSALSAYAEQRSLSEPELARRLVAALRALSGGGPPAALDERVGRFLLMAGPAAARDAAARGLLAAGADPAELHRLEVALAQLRRALAPHLR
jgi:O-antigen/teichoic acid export membrane protein